MSSWRATLHVSSMDVRLLVTDQRGHDIAKAYLPYDVRHPRAILSLLESLGLWGGVRIDAAIFVGDDAPSSFVLDLFGNAMWPESSPIVTLSIPEDRQVRRLRGPGRFGDVYLLHGRAAR